MRLDSWKEIAAYVDCSVRTLQRFEKLEGFPVRRFSNGPKSRVCAYTHEIDAWLSKRPTGNRIADAHLFRIENALMKHQALIAELSKRLDVMKDILAKYRTHRRSL